MAMRNILIFILVACMVSCGSRNSGNNESTNKGSVFASSAIGLFDKEETRPKNIILMIGDGMGVTQITAGLYSNGNKLHLERFKVTGLHKNHSANSLITDSAAGATAFSCGIKTYNGAIGVNADTFPKKTILEIAEKKNLATGLVATSTIVHATPASFIAHQPHRQMYEEIAADFLKTDIDFFVGGGKKYFDRRADGRNLITELTEKGYQTGSYMGKDIDKMKLKNDKFAYFTSDSDPLPVSAGRDYLPYASKLAANFLKNKNENGFFLMIEGSQIDWGGHSNNSDYIVSELLDFDRAVGEILDFAKKDGETLVVVTADHETGGYSIVHGSRMDSLATKFTTDYHTLDLIPVFAYGPGAEAFGGIYDNTTIFDKMMAAYGWRK